MPSLNFTLPGLREKILSGEKTQTIREFKFDRYYQFTKKRDIFLYWKQRTKKCQKIGESFLSNIFLLKFKDKNIGLYYSKINSLDLDKLTWYWLNPAEIADLIERDGLTPQEFYSFFKKTYDIENTIFMVIRWKYPLKRITGNIKSFLEEVF